MPKSSATRFGRAIASTQYDWKQETRNWNGKLETPNSKLGNSNAMKITLFVLCLICATAAFGQTASVLSNYVQPIQIPDHPQHASQHDLAQPQDIFEHSDYTYAKGERPLADFGMHPSEPEPLGDRARTFRIEHASAKKAAFVFEKYVAKK